jgi:hypothetical protein
MTGRSITIYGYFLTLLLLSLTLVSPTVKAFEPFPTRNLVGPPAADPRAPYNHLKLYSFNDEDESQSNLGAEAALTHNFGVTRWEGADGTMYQFTCSAGVFSQFQDAPNGSYELTNSDFYVGFPLEIRTGAHGFRAELYHVSSHLGDEFQARTGQERISFSHESFRGDYMYYPTESLRTFIEVQYAISSTPDFDPWIGATGFEYKWGSYLLATNIKFKQRNDWKHTAVASVLYDLGNENMFVGLEAFDGMKPQGQFFREERTYAGLVFRFNE